MTCTSVLPIDSIAADVRDALADEFIRKNRPLIDNGVLTNPTLKAPSIRGDVILDSAARAAFIRYTGAEYDQEIVDSAIERLDNKIAETTEVVSEAIDDVILGEYRTELEQKVDEQKLDTGIRSVPTVAGAVSRSQQSINNDFIHAKDFGIIGDGSDETDKLNAMFYLASSNYYMFEGDKTYGYNASGITIGSNSNVVTNGCNFIALGQHLTNSFRVIGDNITIDYLRVINTFNGSILRYAQRGIEVYGNNIDIGEISTISDTPRTGANGNTTNSMVIGNDTVTSTNIKIGRVVSVNWDRPLVINNCYDWGVSNVEIGTYLRAIYIKDSSNGDLKGGVIYGLSPSAKGRAGENGLLIESTTEDGSVNDIRIERVTVKDSGEHGFRIGGQKVVRDIWFSSCVTYSSGSGEGTGVEPDDHGGCGFKVLGATTEYGSRHQNINFESCKVYNAAMTHVGTKLNHAGFYLGKVVGATMANCSVGLVEMANSYVPPEVYSCDNGFEIVGSEDVSIIDPTVYRARNDGILILDYKQDGYDWGVSADIRVEGGSIISPNKSCVRVRTTNAPVRAISVKGLLCVGGENALLVEKSGSGGIVECYFDATCWSQTVETLAGASDFVANIVGQSVGNSLCRGGSVLLDQTTQRFSVRESDNMGWKNVVSSLDITIPVGGVVAIPTRREPAQIHVTSETYEYYCQAYIRTTGSPSSLVISKGTKFDVVNTVLTGTTGTSGFITLGVQGSKIYLENRTTVPRVVRVTLF